MSTLELSLSLEELSWRRSGGPHSIRIAWAESCSLHCEGLGMRHAACTMTYRVSRRYVCHAGLAHTSSARISLPCAASR